MRAHMFGVVLVGLILMGGNCSRARVESMNEMNAGVELAQMKRFNEAAQSLEKAGAIDVVVQPMRLQLLSPRLGQKNCRLTIVLRVRSVLLLVIDKRHS